MTETLLYLNMNYVNIAFLGAILLFFVSYISLKKLVNLFPKSRDKFTVFGLWMSQQMAALTLVYCLGYLAYLNYNSKFEIFYVLSAILALIVYLILWKYKQTDFVKSWFILNLVARMSFFVCFLYFLCILRYFDLSQNEFFFVKNLFDEYLEQSMSKNIFLDFGEAYGIMLVFYSGLFSYFKMYMDLTVMESIYLLTFTGLCFRLMSFVISFVHLEPAVEMEQPVQMMLKIGQAGAKYGTMVKPSTQEIALNIRKYNSSPKILEMGEHIQKKVFKEFSPKLVETSSGSAEKTFAILLADVFTKNAKTKEHEGIMAIANILNNGKNNLDNLRKFSPQGSKYFYIDSLGVLQTTKNNLKIIDVVNGFDVDNAVSMTNFFSNELPKEDSKSLDLYFHLLGLNLRTLYCGSSLADLERKKIFPYLTDEDHQTRKSVSRVSTVTSYVTVSAAFSVPDHGSAKLLVMDDPARPVPVSLDDHFTKHKELSALKLSIKKIEVDYNSKVIAVEGAKETKSGDYVLVLEDGKKMPVELTDATYKDYLHFRRMEDISYDMLVKFLAKGYVNKCNQVKPGVLIHANRLFSNSLHADLKPDIFKVIETTRNYTPEEKAKCKLNLGNFSVTSVEDNK